MNTTLSNLIPLAQPYNAAPWNYAGTESVTSIPAGVVDWVLIELRDASTAAAATSATIIKKRAGFLLSNGSIVDLDGTSQPYIGNPVVANNLYIVIRHRNHLAIMSNAGASLSTGVYSYDFTTALAQAYGGGTGYKAIGSLFGMVVGDDNNDGSVNILDYNPWAINFQKASGYYTADLNFDGSINILDYNKWALNFNAVNNANLKSAPIHSEYISNVPK